MASRRRVLLAGLVAFVASVAVVGVSADCQPCDSIYDRCLPACNGMSSCQTRCMQSHFDCRMQVPGCSKATLEAEAEAAAAAAVAVADPTPTPAECYTSCAATYSKCTQACKPGDAACYTQCATTYQQECLPKCGMPAPPSPPSPPSPSSPPSSVTMKVKGVRECLKECKAKGKEANDKCKAEKWIKRGDCYAKVPNMVKACESGCNRKPHGLEFVPSTLTSSSSVSDRPISPSECIANCGYALTVCLKNVDDWCAPTVWGASCHNQGQLQCKMDNNGCQTACQLAPGLAAAETDASVEEEKKQKSIPSRPLLGDCQPCDSIYDACLPACNGMSNCQLKCMQNHFDCRMATPGC